jgi:peptide chain release factor 3
LLDEIESVLKIHCAPVTWPIGMGKRFQGVYHLLNDEVLRFAPGEEKAGPGVRDPARRPDRPARPIPHGVRHHGREIELVRGAGAAFHLDDFLKGRQTPVFFGSGINNFGVREILRALVDWAPPPQPRAADTPTGSRYVEPAEPPFTGFVFKIQANMDPNHRDRIAFFRVCSGQYTPGMKVKQRAPTRKSRSPTPWCSWPTSARAWRRPTPATSSASTTTANCRSATCSPRANPCTTRASPTSPRISSASRACATRSSPSSLQKGLRELGEEGAIQVFAPLVDSNLLLGAVGQLQFEVVEHRLKTEYGVDAIFQPAGIHTARWVTCDETCS